MNRINWLSGFIAVSAILILAGCQRGPESTPITSYPLDSLDGVATLSEVELDPQVSSDGRGSLKIIAREPRTVRLFEVGDLDIENARLIYSAMIKTEGVTGKVYLEMWCRFPGKGEFFSRALHRPIMGTTDWVSQETLFFLKKGENPDNVSLNIVIEGRGTVWIDDIKLTRGRL